MSVLYEFDGGRVTCCDRTVKHRSPLPVDALLPEILSSLQRIPSLVLEAPPGAGKTTRVPPALLEIVSGEVVVLEPRRIAARMAAMWVASEMDEQVGETVGYQVRFEEKVGPQTRLRYLTEGTLTRRLISDPDLNGVDAVVLDEFHERHLDSDLALALLKRLQRRRPELKLVVMSATLDATPIAQFLDGCPMLRSEGRMFALSVTHLPYSPEPLAVQVRDAVQRLIHEGGTGHVLIFLPGAAEIRQAMRECEPIARRHGMLLLPLHGGLSAADQDRAVMPSTQPKLIFSTNVAETSVTIEGVRSVIDSGVARTASYSPWTGLPMLQLGRVSKASAKQRAGRAGRTGPGRVLRLYAEEDYARRPEHDVPEILRTDLSRLCLSLRAMGEDKPEEMEWLDAPPADALTNAESLLDRLGAEDAMAARLVRYPLPPRMARILEESVKRGVGEEGCLIAAILESGLRVEGNDIFDAMESRSQDPQFLLHLKQLRRYVPAAPRKQQAHDDAVLQSILCGFPDRVAVRRAGKQIMLANGVTAEIQGERSQYEFMVVMDVEDRSDRSLPLARMTARIEPEWLLDLFPERVKERAQLEWNRSSERVELVSALMYDGLILEETRRPAPEEAAAELLYQKSTEIGIERFIKKEELDRLLLRMDFAGLKQPDLLDAFRQLCTGLSSFSELRKAGEFFVSALEQSADQRLLRERAPDSIRLAGGRQVKVQYEQGKEPWIASRLQDFFGMQETPRIGIHQKPLVVHLLAPNHRAVQTTTDLKGFWARLYPEVRRTLMRRYPKHSWPERP